MSLKDVMQMGKGKKLKKPEIRVWFYPASKGGGDDYARIYPSLADAKQAIKSHRAALKLGANVDVPEKRPLVAYKGREYSVAEFKKKKLAKLS